MKITRIDRAGSFQTIFAIKKDNETQELKVNVWNADETETKLVALSWEEISALRELDNDGGVVIKEQ